MPRHFPAPVLPSRRGDARVATMEGWEQGGEHQYEEGEDEDGDLFLAGLQMSGSISSPGSADDGDFSSSSDTGSSDGLYSTGYMYDSTVQVTTSIPAFLGHRRNAACMRVPAPLVLVTMPACTSLPAASAVVPRRCGRHVDVVSGGDRFLRCGGCPPQSVWQCKC